MIFMALRCYIFLLRCLTFCCFRCWMLTLLQAEHWRRAWHWHQLTGVSDFVHASQSLAPSSAVWLPDDSWCAIIFILMFSSAIITWQFVLFLCWNIHANAVCCHSSICHTNLLQMFRYVKGGLVLPAKSTFCSDSLELPQRAGPCPQKQGGGWSF